VAARSAKKLAGEGVEWTATLGSLASAGVALAQGDGAGGVAHLREALAGAEACEMLLHAAVARECLGERMGGAEGAELVREARAWMASQGVRVPERMAATIAPLPLPPRPPSAARS
jgi:hypothetical protein